MGGDLAQIGETQLTTSPAFTPERQIPSMHTRPCFLIGSESGIGAFFVCALVLDDLWGWPYQKGWSFLLERRIMNRWQARNIAESSVTVCQIRAVLDAAQNSSRLDAPSKLNSSFTREQALSIFRGAFSKMEGSQTIERAGMIVSATNVLREFGEYW